jgi:hypothetical protein
MSDPPNWMGSFKELPLYCIKVCKVLTVQSGNT